MLYNDILARTEPERILHLAIRDVVYLAIFEEPIGKILLENQRVRLVVFNSDAERIIQWVT